MSSETLKELVERLTTGPAPYLTLGAAHLDGTLAKLIPELDVLYGIEQPAQWHPEICTGLHMEMVMQMAERLGASPRARFAALVHDLGKAATPKDVLPKHIMHEQRGVPLVKDFCARLGAPEDWARLGMLTSEFHLHAHMALTLTSGKLVSFLMQPAFSEDQSLFEDFLLACEADKRGRGGNFDLPYPQRKFLLAAMAKVKAVTAEPHRLHEARCASAQAVKKEFVAS